MFIQIVIAGILLLILVNLILNLIYLKSPSLDSKMPKNAPMVSVLIPARNEEDKIAQCLETLLRQDYLAYEILVLDDESTDSTAGIVKQFAAKDNRLRIISGLPLPDGWSGKNYACHQLAEEAKGEWLLFVDADTTHAPNMLSSVMSLALQMNISLLSGFPRQIADSPVMKIFTPTWYFILMTWCPLWWMQQSKKNMPSIAIGQFMLFSRREYWRIGGHESVKSKVLEDIWLGVEVNKHGGKHIAVDLSDVVFCKMYDDFKGIWNGLTRSVYAVAEISVIALASLIIFAFICYLIPFYSLWNEYSFASVDKAVAAIIIFQIVSIYLMRWMADRRFHQKSILPVVLHPVGIIFLIFVVANAIIQKLAGTGIRWKERFYTEESSGDENVVETRSD
jgi:chlorobactene glucosyltransferase